jgi:hypothetical protein
MRVVYYIQISVYLHLKPPDVNIVRVVLEVRKMEVGRKRVARAQQWAAHKVKVDVAGETPARPL